jgi:RNA polymerase sigma-70 factor (ECF subfamily)
VTLDDSVRLALLVVLERLSPAERVTFVLHDIFQLPFDAVAETVGRSEPNCRQLARRARLKIEAPDAGRRFDVTHEEHREVTERFIAACANGSIEELLDVLDPEVSGGVDLLPGLVVRGSHRVAQNMLTYWGPGATLVSLPVTGDPCLLAFIDRRLAGVVRLTVDGGRVSKIHVHAQPTTLAVLEQQLSAS